MERLFLTMISLLTMTVVSAQSFDASAVIEKTSQIYAAWGGMDVQFTTRISNEKNGSSESFEGVIRMKNNKFVLTTPEMTIWFDGTTQWTYMPYNEEVSINTPAGDDLRLLNPMLFLQDYKKDYSVTAIGESTSVNAKAAYDIQFTPKKKDNIENIVIQIEKNTSLPVKIVISIRNCSRITLNINELKSGNPADEIFSFPRVSYPNVAIIDLR